MEHVYFRPEKYISLLLQCPYIIQSIYLCGLTRNVFVNVRFKLFMYVLHTLKTDYCPNDYCMYKISHLRHVSPQVPCDAVYRHNSIPPICQDLHANRLWKPYTCTCMLQYYYSYSGTIMGFCQ